MKHILFIQPSLDSVGGIEKVVPTLALSLAEKDYLVSAYVFYGQVQETQDFWHLRTGEQEDIALGLINKVKKVARRLSSLRTFIKETEPDCVVVSAQGAIILTVLLRFFGFVKVPVVAYIHEARNDGGILYRFLTALFYPLADGLVAVSIGIKKELQSLLFVSKNKIHLVYNSLPPVDFTETKLNQIADKLVSYSRPLYVTAGRLEKTKGLDVLVESFLEYARNNKGTLLVMGTGSLLTALENKVTISKMNNRVIFLGRVSDVPLYIKNCDAYLSMARSEPFGLALIESLSAGVPVIATDVPSGPREILSPTIAPDSYPYKAEYGILLSAPSVFKQDAESLQNGLALLQVNLYKPDLLKRRANDFSPGVQADAFVRVLQEII